VMDGTWEALAVSGLSDGRFPWLVAGVDEVGRGALAGPVTSACVVFPLPVERFAGYGIADSKLLTPEKRETLSRWIEENALFTALGWASVDEIERLNIRRATMLSMGRALQTLPQTFLRENSILVAVDGKDLIADLPFPQTAVVGGDGMVLSIAAASILAKVARDRYMGEIDSEFPEFRFRIHKGYGTKDHREAIRRYGLSRHHRPLFCRKALEPGSS